MNKTGGHAMVADGQCPLCFMSARIPVPTTRTLDVDCGRCGHYRITSTLAEFPPRDNVLFEYLRAATRQSYEAGQALLLTTENWQELAQRRRATAVAIRALNCCGTSAGWRKRRKLYFELMLTRTIQCSTLFRAR